MELAHHAGQPVGAQRLGGHDVDALPSAVIESTE